MIHILWLVIIHVVVAFSCCYFARTSSAKLALTDHTIGDIWWCLNSGSTESQVVALSWSVKVNGSGVAASFWKEVTESGFTLDSTRPKMTQDGLIAGVFPILLRLSAIRGHLHISRQTFIFLVARRESSSVTCVFILSSHISHLWLAFVLRGVPHSCQCDTPLGSETDGTSSRITDGYCRQRCTNRVQMFSKLLAVWQLLHRVFC